MLDAILPTGVGDRWRLSVRNWLLLLSRDAYALLALAISVLATCYYQSVATFWWGGADHLDNLSMAWWFLHMAHGADAPGRTPGMALFLIATGVPIFNTWKGLILAFALMSIAIPMFAYFIVAPVSRPLGLLAATLMIVSVIPYVNSKNGFGEELFHFLHFLALLLALRYFFFGCRRTLFCLTAALFALCLVRPVAALYFWIFIVVAMVDALARKRSLRPLIVAMVSYAGAMGTWAVVNHTTGNAFFSPNLALTTGAQKRAAEVYFDGPLHPLDQAPPRFAINPAHGSASHQLYTVLVDHIRKKALQWQAAPSAARPAVLFGDPAQDPEAMATRVLSTPIFPYFDLIIEAAHSELGYQAGEHLLLGIGREYGTVGIWGMLRYIIQNPIRLIVGGTPPMGNRNFFGLFLYTRFRSAMKRFYTVDPGGDSGGVDLVDSTNGPASRELVQGVRLYIEAYPSAWDTENAWYSRYKENPEGLLPEIFRSPEPSQLGMYEGFLYEASVALFGYAQADRIYNRAAWETLRRYPFAAAIIWDNALSATVLPTFGALKSQLTDPPYALWAPDMLSTLTTDFTSLTPGLARELVPTIMPNSSIRLFGKAYAVFHLFSFVFVVTAILMVGPALRSPAGTFVAFVSLAYLYDVAVIAVYGNFGTQRYYDVFIFLPVLVTTIGCGEVLSMFSPRSINRATNIARSCGSPGQQRP